MEWNEFVENRKIAFVALTGSHNYNLNTPTSDRDYKAFVFPNFEDLYSNKMFSKSVVTETFDATVHDVRKLPELWWKANINFIEVLFSIETQLVDNRFRSILKRRDEFATMNIPYLYHASRGMHFQKMSDLHSGTEGTKPLIDEFGYDTKQACHAIRCLIFLERFQRYGSIEKALWLKVKDRDRTLLIGIKKGYVREDGLLELAKEMEEKSNSMREWYESQTPKPELKEELDEIIKEIVRERL